VFSAYHACDNLAHAAYLAKRAEVLQSSGAIFRRLSALNALDLALALFLIWKEERAQLSLARQSTLQTFLNWTVVCSREDE
jgi:hypothetical protein